MRRVSPSMVVALIALFVALSGSAYAVTALPRNSVGSSQLKSNAVTASKIKSSAVTEAKIKKSAVTSSKIKDGTITIDDIATATRTSLTGATGAQGPAGPTGATGAQGPAGPTATAAVTESATAPLTTSDATVTSLLAPTSGTSTGALVLTESMRVVATGSVYVYKESGDSTDQSTVVCSLQQKEAAASGYSTLGYATETFLPATDPTVSPVIIHDNVTLFGWADLPAGTYDIRVRCKRQGNLLFGGGDASYGHAELAVIAAAD